MRRILALALLAYIACAQSPKATGPTFRVKSADLSSPPVFVIYGDMRFTRWRFAGSASSPWARQALVRKITSEKPDALFVSGDVPYQGADFDDYRVFEEETRVWREQHMRLYPVLGNHELYNREFMANRERALDNWWKEFPAMRGLEWYSVQLGEQIYVLCLDSNSGALQAKTRQRIWLEQQVASLPNSLQYVFFVLHHARAGDYLEGDQRAFKGGGDLETYLEHRQKLSRARFVVVAGHDHNYARMQRNGVIYIVSGGGGAHPVLFRRRREDSFKGKDLLHDGRPLPNYNYVKFVLNPGSLSATMTRISNPEAAGSNPAWDSPDAFSITPRY